MDGRIIRQEIIVRALMEKEDKSQEQRSNTSRDIKIKRNNQKEMI